MNMVSTDTKLVINQAKNIYNNQLKVALEANHRGQFVAIEPVSGDYFVSDTLDGAVQAARARHPDRLSHTLRVGYPAALHLGNAEW
jgi:hypothetical protein